MNCFFIVSYYLKMDTIMEIMPPSTIGRFNEPNRFDENSLNERVTSNLQN